MRETKFYHTASGRCSIEGFLDSLDDRQAQKVVWVLRLIRDLEIVPTEYFKRLINTDDI